MPLSELSVLFSLMLAFGCFSIVETYLRALASRSDVLMPALGTGAAAVLLGVAAQQVVQVSPVIVAFCLALASSGAWVAAGRRGAWRGR